MPDDVELSRLISAMDELIAEDEQEDDWTRQRDAAHYKAGDAELWDALDRGYYGRDGRPISLHQWSYLLANFEYKVVRRNHLHHAMVSTVWLGLDHGWLEDGRPLIFETEIFPQRNRDARAAWQGRQWRWSTEAEARRGHQCIVEAIRARGVNRISTRKQEAEFWRTWRGHLA
jgi:hypothetical protein